MHRDNMKSWMRKRRHRRVRGRVHGTADRPRLCIFRSSKQIYAQVIDDDRGVTLCAASSVDLGRGGSMADGAKGGNVAGARVVGLEISKRATDAGISQVAFDRGGFRYHGRVKALADGAREGGLNF